MDSAFSLPRGVIVACDIAPNMDNLKRLVDETKDVDGIVAYKLGRRFEIKTQLGTAIDVIKDLTLKPIIVDVQKEGNDVEFTEPEFIGDYSSVGVKNLILFPLASPRVQKVCVDACRKHDIMPIGGYRMTQKLFTSDESGEIWDVGTPNEKLKGKLYRGYISPDAMQRAYELYADLDIDFYIAPGTLPEEIRKIREIVEARGINPSFGLPGIGRQQGEISSSFEPLKGVKGAYAIIGSSIYKAPNVKEAAKMFADEALKFL